MAKEAALSAAASLRPDVIVLDIPMPGMSGFEVAAELRKAGSTAAIVFLTVHDDAEFIEASQASARWAGRDQVTTRLRSPPRPARGTRLPSLRLDDALSGTTRTIADDELGSLRLTYSLQRYDDRPPNLTADTNDVGIMLSIGWTY